MKKISLITYWKNIKDVIDGLCKLKYKKIYFIYKEWSYLTKKEKGIIPIQIFDKKKISCILKNIIRQNPKETFVPFFRGDSNSKYMIYSYNLLWKKIDRKEFRHKDLMNKRMKDIGNKTSFSIQKKEIKNVSFKGFQKEHSISKFIIKPHNSSASTSTYKIESEDEFNEVKKKLINSNQYIVEEYLEGKLYSVDFLFDGENLLLLAYVKETSNAEYIEQQKFTPDFMNKYWDDINKDLLYILPVRYSLHFEDLSSTEKKFLREIKKILKKLDYKGIIHLEYKYDSMTKKIGFIERWARMWGQRSELVKKLHYFDIRDLMYDAFAKQDISKWEEKWWLHYFKDKNKGHHLIWIKTSFLKKTHIWDLLIKNNDFFSIWYTQFLKNYLLKKFGLEVENAYFYYKTKNNFFYHTSDSKWTYFIVYLEVFEEQFLKFKKNQSKIIEQLIFHDYQ